MERFSKPFNLQNSLSMPQVTADYLKALGIEESCVVYYDKDGEHDIPEEIHPISEILKQDFDCVVPAWGHYFLVRKGKYCGAVNGNFGNVIIEPIYLTIIPPINCHNFVVQNKNGQWGVLQTNALVPIIDFGVYEYLWGYDNGLCLVTTFNSNKQTFSNRGVINKEGKEVVSPYTYTDIYNFYGKNTDTIKVQYGNINLYLSKDDLKQVVFREPKNKNVE